MAPQTPPLPMPFQTQNPRPTALPTLPLQPAQASRAHACMSRKADSSAATLLPRFSASTRVRASSARTSACARDCTAASRPAAIRAAVMSTGRTMWTEGGAARGAGQVAQRQAFGERSMARTGRQAGGVKQAPTYHQPPHPHVGTGHTSCASASSSACPTRPAPPRSSCPHATPLPQACACRCAHALAGYAPLHCPTPATAQQAHPLPAPKPLACCS
jgi:hypothetical protein